MGQILTPANMCLIVFLSLCLLLFVQIIAFMRFRRTKSIFVDILQKTGASMNGKVTRTMFGAVLEGECRGRRIKCDISDYNPIQIQVSVKLNRSLPQRSFMLDYPHPAAHTSVIQGWVVENLRRNFGEADSSVGNILSEDLFVKGSGLVERWTAGHLSRNPHLMEVATPEAFAAHVYKLIAICEDLEADIQDGALNGKPCEEQTLRRKEVFLTVALWCFIIGGVIALSVYVLNFCDVYTRGAAECSTACQYFCHGKNLRSR